MNGKELAINLLLIQGENVLKRGKKVEKQASVLNFIHYVSKPKMIFKNFYSIIYFEDLYK